MINALTTAAGLVFLPLGLSWAYGRLLLRLSGRKQRPDSLDKRWRGYSLLDVRGYWKDLADEGRAAEEQFLLWDLSYPFVYGGSLAAAVLVARSRISLHVPLVALLAPIVITSLADGLEDLLLLRQLQRYKTGGETAVDEGPIRLASAATRIKLAFLVLSFLTLLVLAALVSLKAAWAGQ